MNSFALLTDLYQLTMAYGYWKMGMQDLEASFYLSFRKRPFNGGYAISAGLEAVIKHIESFKFTASDLTYLEGVKDPDGAPLFSAPFLDYLAQLKFSCDVDAVPEGEVVFPYEPLLRIKGPIIQCQLLESPLLTLTNFATLIATKAARITTAAKDDLVYEFGLRRAQGIDGAITASRSAFIGGCVATSNVIAGKLFGIPVIGTHAHSWVMAFESEIDSFEAYAEAMPTNCVFLVDTYNTLQGVKNAISVGEKLRKKGYELRGIRLDSGDLAYLSIESRKLLDLAGFTETKIIASNELEENLIHDLKQQGAKISYWGIGTHLVTGHSQAALDGVYKLSAIRKKGGMWEYKLKLSEQMAKISNPGILQVRRYHHPSFGYVGDAIYDVETDLQKGCQIIDPFDQTRQKWFAPELVAKDLLVPIFREGRVVYKSPSLNQIQTYAKEELSKFDKSIKRFVNPHLYPVGLEKGLYEKKIRLIEKVRRLEMQP